MSEERAPKRFAIRIDWWWRPLMLFVAATPANSYVEVSDADVRFRFGAGFDRTLPRDSIAGVARGSWPMINGIGVRAGGELFGLIGSTAGIVEVAFVDSMPLPFAGWPWSARRLAVSLDDPDGFVAVMSS